MFGIFICFISKTKLKARDYRAWLVDLDHVYPTIQQTSCQY